jgi:hypothetical protein
VTNFLIIEVVPNKPSASKGNVELASGIEVETTGFALITKYKSRVFPATLQGNSVPGTVIPSGEVSSPDEV